MALRPVPPMLARKADELPAGGDWTYEVKWDGYRTLAVKDGGSVTLWSRNLKNATRQFPGVARAVARIRAATALLDGEVVALDEAGRPSFQALHHQAATTIVYYAFDLLHHDGRDLLHAPIEERRAILSQVVDGSPVLLSAPLPGSPAQIARAIQDLRLEGVVAKRTGSIYQPGVRSHAWIKVRFNQRDTFVVGGFKPHDSTFESLLVGQWQGGALLFAGKVRAGFTPRLRADVMRRIAPLIVPGCPFANLPSPRVGRWGEGVTPEDMAALRWVQPRVRVDVSFVEWTRDGLLRHSQFAALAADQ